MILWFIVGSIVWVLCVLFVIAIVHSGRKNFPLNNEQIQQTYMVNNQNTEDSIKKEVKKTTRTRGNRCLPISKIG